MSSGFFPTSDRMWYIYKESSNPLPHNQPEELCPVNILNSSVTPPQFIVGAVLAVNLDISVLNRQLVCSSLLEPLASVGIILYVFMSSDIYRGCLYPRGSPWAPITVGGERQELQGVIYLTYFSALPQEERS